MINPKVEKELNSFNELVSRIVDQSKNLKSLKQVEPELVEDLQQIVVGLHYTMQTLVHKLELSKISNSGTEFSGFHLSFRKNPIMDKPLDETADKHMQESNSRTSNHPA